MTTTIVPITIKSKFGHNNSRHNYPTLLSSVIHMMRYTHEQPKKLLTTPINFGSYRSNQYISRMTDQKHTYVSAITIDSIPIRQRRVFSNSSESVVHQDDDDDNNSETKITKRIDEINVYVENQIKTMQFFEYMMNMDPNVSNDPADFVYCRDQLRPLAVERTPPKIQDELIMTSQPSHRHLLHVAIRQSKLYTQLAMAVLRRGYYNAKGNPWLLGWAMTQGTEEEFKNDEAFYTQRYQGLWRYNIIKKMSNLPKVGTFIMYDDDAQESLVVEYHRNLRTHFSNAPAFPKPQTSTRPLGNVHVAMGFNDLQILLEHVDDISPMIQDDTNNKGDNRSSIAAPMKFIGYDRSTYSLAKTLVIAQMLQQPTVSPHHIIEAWYSSTWNYETFMLFRYTCITLLNNDAYIDKQRSIMSYPGNVNEEIRQYLHHWAYDAVPISAVEAIQRWFYESSKHGQVYTLTCSFCRYNDRISLLQYFMTGEFNSNNKNQANMEMVGSLAMWSVPDWAPNPNMSDQDRVNNTVLFQSILDEIKSHPNDDIHIMNAMYNIKLRQVRNLQRAVQSKEIQIDIRYGDIQPLHRANRYLIDEIRDLKATTMSWSNLVDYFDVGLFHELAHDWSSINDNGSTTTHYGYTMNWPTTCFGTIISDYPTRKERAKLVFEMIEVAKKEAEKTGIGYLVTVPSFEHTEDQGGELLAKHLRPKWVEYFVKEGKTFLPMNRNIVVNDAMQLHSPILRTNRNIYLSWTYQ